jgi:hypothetical protein
MGGRWMTSYIPRTASSAFSGEEFVSSFLTHVERLYVCALLARSMLMARCRTSLGVVSVGGRLDQPWPRPQLEDGPGLGRYQAWLCVPLPPSFSCIGPLNRLRCISLYVFFCEKIRLSYLLPKSMLLRRSR